MASIKDVAKKANVGIATVSRVINNKVTVSEDTRRIVLEAIAELNYVPSEIARNFQNKNVSIVGVIVPYIHHTFTAELLSRLEKELHDHNLKMLLCSSNYSESVEAEYFEMLSRKEVGGIIITAPIGDLDNFKKYEKLPIVSFDRKISKSIPCITSQNYEGAVIATQKLIDAGCKSLAYLGFGADINSFASLRLNGFIDTCEKNNVKYFISNKSIGDDLNNGYVSKFFDNYEFDGLFSASDHFAMLAYYEALNRNISVPKELKIIGYDGLMRIQDFNPTIATMDQQINLIAYTIVEQLIKKLANHEYNNDSIIPIKFQKGHTL